MKSKERISYSAKDHTFVICAYGESEFLEECILSVKRQKIQTSIVMSTATPNSYIESMAKKYQIPLKINSKQEGIAADWNFAYRQAKTALVTLAHQDDIYLPEYTLQILQRASEAKKPLILFSDYGELRNGEAVYQNKLLNIKRMMLRPLKCKLSQRSIWIRRRVLSMGNPICCPSVTYVKANLSAEPFTVGFRSNIDWLAWEEISRNNGSFVYCNKALMCHRIHSESATSEIIADNDRSKEDFEMFKRFWPERIAKRIEKHYRNSEDSNQIE